MYTGFKNTAPSQEMDHQTRMELIDAVLWVISKSVPDSIRVPGTTTACKRYSPADIVKEIAELYLEKKDASNRRLDSEETCL